MLLGETNIVKAYHTLSATRLDLGELPSAIADRFPRYREGIPATLLGRLAVTSTQLGNGYGVKTLMNALEVTYAATETVASAFMIVRAIDDNAFRFYRKYGFEPLPDDPRRLFLPMDTIRHLIESS
jgi:predicted GNAT family N-acyltransferase